MTDHSLQIWLSRLLRLLIFSAALLGGIFPFARGSAPVRTDANIPFTAPVNGLRATPTPFQPVPATAIPEIAPAAPEDPWQGVVFADPSQRITVALNHLDMPIQVDFRPGWPCSYYDRTACVGLYEDEDSNVLLVTLHSGVGGDGQPLRHALEGTGWNSAGLPLDAIHANMEKLRDDPVSIRQGETTADGFHIVALLRVPPEGLERYLGQPVTGSLEEFAQHDAELSRALKEPLLVIETCGWRHPDEISRWPAEETTGSIYLLVIGRE